MVALGGIAPEARSAWQECSLADSLVSAWSTTLGVSMWRGHVVGHPVAWRLWLRMPAKPKAPPIVVVRHREDAHGDRCVALTDVEMTLVLAALEEGHCGPERFVELLRARQADMSEGRVRAIRWDDVCELAGVDPWRVAARARTSLGASLAQLGLEAVRIEVSGGVA